MAGIVQLKDENGNPVYPVTGANLVDGLADVAKSGNYNDLENKPTIQTINTVNVSVDNNTGTPSATGTVSGTTLSLNFHNLKGQQGIQGQQGNTGSSVDYPYELVNNLTTDDATKGLSAAQGVVLDNKVGQLRSKAIDLYSNLTHGITYTTNVSVGNIVSTTPNSSTQTWAAGIFECVPGDVFNFDATGGNVARLWCFTDADYKCLSNSLAGARTEKVTAPSNAAFLFVNINTTYTPHTFEKIIKRIDTIEAELAKTIGDVSLLQGVVYSSNIAPETTATIVTGQTNNVFIDQSYPVKKGMRVRVMMAGLGTIIKRFRMYDNIGNTYYIEESPYDFVAENDFAITRIAVVSGAVITAGQVTAKIDCIGSQQAITELQAGIKEDTALVSLQTIKNAASTDGNLFTGNISLVASSGKISSIFQVASKYIKTEEYDEVAGEIPRIVFNNGFSYCLSGEQLTIKEFRVPQLSPTPGNITVDITIPTGVQLIISDFVQRYSTEQNRGDLMIYNHGKCGASNFCCKGAWEMANKYGAYGAVVVPKRTSDGKWVCFHDDGDVNGVMFYEDKSSILSGVTVNNSTFAETQLWRYKTAYTSPFNINPDGTATTDKIPLLEDFFKLCAKTGMRPCLSWHPYPTDIENGHYRDFVEMKALADKYGITNKLCIKIGSSGADRLVDLHSVFGDSLDMVLVNVGNKTYEEILGYLRSGGNDIFDKTKTKYGIEYSSDMDVASETVINNLVAEGYIVGMCYITDGERMEWCIEHGIRDYTLDNFASWGLHW